MYDAITKTKADDHALRQARSSRGMTIYGKLLLVETASGTHTGLHLNVKLSPFSNPNTVDTIGITSNGISATDLEDLMRDECFQLFTICLKDELWKASKIVVRKKSCGIIHSKDFTRM